MANLKNSKTQNYLSFNKKDMLALVLIVNLRIVLFDKGFVLIKSFLLMKLTHLLM